MPPLNIVLTSGFDDDLVTVTVDGTVVLDGPVTTDHRIGVARAVPPVQRSGPAVVEVHLPNRGLTATAEITDDQQRVEVEQLEGRVHIVPMATQEYGHA